MKALITGINGQDGSYLAELLLDKNYEVHGIIRRSSTFNNTKNIDHIKDRLNLYYSDLIDSASIRSIIENVLPDEIYNLGAFTHVGQSFKCPEYVMDVNGTGVLRILEILRNIKTYDEVDIKYYQASTSELYGDAVETPQTEKTPFNPVSPYGIAKQAGFYYTKMYREAYDIFACNGILFNHESFRRSEDFVSKKIIKAVVAINKGLQDVLYLGNLNAQRDWGYSPDYVKAMWLMLQQEKPRDYVIATNETHTVREFVELAFKEVGIIVDWTYTGEKEKGYNVNTGETLVKIDPQFYRPCEVNILQGDHSKAFMHLGWQPNVYFEGLVKKMIKDELNG